MGYPVLAQEKGGTSTCRAGAYDNCGCMEIWQSVLLFPCSAFEACKVDTIIVHFDSVRALKLI